MKVKIISSAKDCQFWVPVNQNISSEHGTITFDLKFYIIECDYYQLMIFLKSPGVWTIDHKSIYYDDMSSELWCWNCRNICKSSNIRLLFIPVVKIELLTFSVCFSLEGHSFSAIIPWFQPVPLCGICSHWLVYSTNGNILFE